MPLPEMAEAREAGGGPECSFVLNAQQQDRVIQKCSEASHLSPDIMSRTATVLPALSSHSRPWEVNIRQRTAGSGRIFTHDIWR